MSDYKIIDGMRMYSPDKKSCIPVVNFTVEETWTAECPNCPNEQDAPFNEKNPMQPMEQECNACGTKFLLTYERD